MSDIANLRGWVHWRKKEGEMDQEEADFTNAIESLLNKCERYEKTLKNLAKGFHSLANVADQGHKNMQCLALRIKQAREALEVNGEAQ